MARYSGDSFQALAAAADGNLTMTIWSPRCGGLSELVVCEKTSLPGQVLRSGGCGVRRPRGAPSRTNEPTPVYPHLHGEGRGVARVITPVHGGTFTALLEQLQEGYVSAVAATAGCSINFFRHDTFGMDALIVRHKDEARETHLYVQLKCTTTVPAGSAPESFTFSFKSDSQVDHLRAPVGASPPILIVMLAHPEQAKWTEGSHDSLTVRHSCYWKNVASAPPDETGSDLSVRINRSQRFDAESLIAIMDRIEMGGEP